MWSLTRPRSSIRYLTVSQSPLLPYISSPFHTPPCTSSFTNSPCPWHRRGAPRVPSGDSCGSGRTTSLLRGCGHSALWGVVYEHINFRSLDEIGLIGRVVPCWGTLQRQGESRDTRCMYPSTLFESCHICNTTHRSRRCAGGAQLLDATVPPTVVVDVQEPNYWTQLYHPP